MRRSLKPALQHYLVESCPSEMKFLVLSAQYHLGAHAMLIALYRSSYHLDLHLVLLTLHSILCSAQQAHHPDHAHGLSLST